MLHQNDREWPATYHRNRWIAASQADEEYQAKLRSARDAKVRVMLQHLLMRTLGLIDNVPETPSVIIEGVEFTAWPIMREDGMAEVWKLAIVDYCSGCHHATVTIVESAAAVGRHIQSGALAQHQCRRVTQ